MPKCCPYILTRPWSFTSEQSVWRSNATTTHFKHPNSTLPLDVTRVGNTALKTAYTSIPPKIVMLPGMLPILKHTPGTFGRSISHCLRSAFSLHPDCSSIIMTASAAEKKSPLPPTTKIVDTPSSSKSGRTLHTKAVMGSLSGETKAFIFSSRILRVCRSFFIKYTSYKKQRATQLVVVLNFLPFPTFEGKKVS